MSENRVMLTADDLDLTRCLNEGSTGDFNRR
jgi:hypothetical protein